MRELGQGGTEAEGNLVQHLEQMEIKFLSFLNTYKRGEGTIRNRTKLTSKYSAPRCR
jgi:hypothetical protein